MGEFFQKTASIWIALIGFGRTVETSKMGAFVKLEAKSRLKIKLLGERVRVQRESPA